MISYVSFKTYHFSNYNVSSNKVQLIEKHQTITIPPAYCIINSLAALLTFSISGLRGRRCCCQGTPGVLDFRHRCNDWHALHSNWAWRACLSSSARAV